MPDTKPTISPEEKDRILAANRQLLDRDLMERRLVYASRPRAVDLQLSNVCNMSCTMCYDGVNPPKQVMASSILDKLGPDVMQCVAMLTPFVGSEPLLVTWDKAKELAETFGIELDLITNAQFLDEEMFAELEPHVSTLTFSIDSHMRDVYDRIRLRSQPDKVFKNLPRAAALCRQHGIEPQANVVVMVENAAWLDETVEFLADQGCLTIRLLEFHLPPDLSPERGFSDPRKHLSSEYLDWMIEKVRKVAERKKVRLIYEGETRFIEDFRPDGLELREGIKTAYAAWDLLPYFLPGYCVQSVDRIKVHADGKVYPCCVAQGDDLVLGDLNESSFEEVWNGANAQQLRALMLTGDVPDTCRSCGFHTAHIPEERDSLPFVTWFEDVWSGGKVREVPPQNRTLVLEGPDHMARDEEPPTFRWQGSETVDEWFVVLSVGGTHHVDNQVHRVAGSERSFQIPAESWAALRGNLGHWWTVYGIRQGDEQNAVRARSVRCVIRRDPIPAVPGHDLRG